MKKSFKNTIFSALTVFCVCVLFSSVCVQKAHAAAMTEASVRLDRMVVSEGDNQILVVAKVPTTATEISLTVDFADNGDFDVDSTASNITVSTGSIPSTYQGESLTAWPGVGSAASSVSNEVVTFASTTLTPGTLYGFYITAGIDNPSSAAAYALTLTTNDGSGAVDTSNVTVRTVTSGTPDSDQLTITGVVPSAMNCVLSANTDSFTTDLSTSAVVSTTGVTYTITTNANSGWIAWVNSANQGLTSTIASHTISTTGTVNDSPDTLSTGTEGYVLDVDLTTDSATGGTGTVTLDAEYNGASTSAGGTLPSTLEEIATADGVTDGDVLTLIARASISILTPAANDYTDTHTYVCAGNF